MVEPSLDNYVRLESGKSVIVRATDWSINERSIVDPVTQRPKNIRSLIIAITEEDGRAVSKTLSVVSEKLASLLLPILQDTQFKQKRFRITKRGSGFATDFTVELLR